MQKPHRKISKIYILLYFLQCPLNIKYAAHFEYIFKIIVKLEMKRVCTRAYKYMLLNTLLVLSTNHINSVLKGLV